MIHCTLELEYEDEKTSSVIAKSLEPDNEDFVEMNVEDNTIFCRIEAEEPLELLHTIDDFLSCLTVAEEAQK